MHTDLPRTTYRNQNARSSSRLSRTDAVKRYLKHETDVKSVILEIELLLLALAIGVQDAICFPDFHCFASNQTGNTVLFAVGILLNDPVHGEPPLFAISTLGVSLGFFSLGVFVTGQIANYFNIGQMRGWLVVSNVLQTMLVFLAAGLQWHYKENVGPDTTMGRILVGLLAFSSGSQVAVVRGLKITDITTAMATAAYIDIFIDRKLFAKLSENRARNRRVLFLAMLAAGSFIGAGVGRKTNLGVAVLVSGAIKSIVALMFAVTT
jgi:uncharacterized membrane protein YoaK (UPF0700 family)